MQTGNIWMFKKIKIKCIAIFPRSTRSGLKLINHLPVAEEPCGSSPAPCCVEHTFPNTSLPYYGRRDEHWRYWAGSDGHGHKHMRQLGKLGTTVTQSSVQLHVFIYTFTNLQWRKWNRWRCFLSYIYIYQWRHQAADSWTSSCLDVHLLQQLCTHCQTPQQSLGVVLEGE